MLKEILRELYLSGTYSKATIGKNLNISENMVEELISQLIRMAYLKEDMGSPTCKSKCNGCAVSNCNINPMKILTVTQKGKELINKEKQKN
ncbi:MAG: hypothetical protein GX231_00660 [Tissierellia bacterium]|nr:hypothetical protein [Tissierellia bacterium]